MKKFYLMTVMIALMTATVMAQTPVKFGVQAGVNFAKFGFSGVDGDDDGNKALTSFQIGAFADISVGTSFSIQPGLTFSGKGAKSEYKEDDYEETGTTQLWYLEIPVNAVYKIDKFYIGAGPYAAFAVSGKDKWKYTEDGETESDSEKIKFGSGDDADLKGSDFGVNVLAGYQLDSGIGIGLNYGLGLANLWPGETGDAKMKNRVFSVSVRYMF